MSYLQHTSLKRKASVYFMLAFIVLWIVCSVVLFTKFRNAMWESLAEQMRSRAEIVAERIDTDPIVIPLPQEDESYMILLYQESLPEPDTLFAPPADFQIGPSGDSERTVNVQVETEQGLLCVIYSVPTGEVKSRIRGILALIVVIFLLGTGLSYLLAYWLSGKLLTPVKQLVVLADETDILGDIRFLPEQSQVDELNELAVSFNRMLQRIKTQTESQKAFFASASHELRTPLSVMQTRLQVLIGDGTCAPHIREFYDEQLTEVRRMIRMVNDFLLMSELQAGVVKVVKSSCDITGIVTDTIAIYKKIIRERNLQVRISLLPTASMEAEADRDKLIIIIRNLLENAFKYAREHSVVKIQIEQGYHITLSIFNEIRSDIHPDINAIREQFYHSKPFEGEGSGLGLWITSQLAALQQFDFTVSIAPEGSVFCARLALN